MSTTAKERDTNDAAEPPFDPVPALAAELGLRPSSVAAVVRLLQEGATVPFIARYRKEQTGSLDEVQIRAIEERHTYLAELDATRRQVLRSIREQGKLTEDLERRIRECTTKAALDDLYLPFKPKRRTRAMIARERGLEPLAELIRAQAPSPSPAAAAAPFVDASKEVPDVDAALAGARDIVAEGIAEDASVRSYVRDVFGKEGELRSVRVKTDSNERTKFEDYYDYREAVPKVPSHRFLAIRRGEDEGVLRATIEVDAERIVQRLETMAGLDARSPFADELRKAVADAYKRLLVPTITTDVRVELKLRADREAVQIFADNLRNLLLAAPLGGKPVVGIDPGLRTGCKVVAIDATGKYLDSTLVHIHAESALERSRRELAGFLHKHRPVAIAVGNGTGGREAEAFARSVTREEKLDGIIVIPVSESGASVYSASDVAREEFPSLDVTVRGAISIARRLQDPLAELVKIEPKAIGVGQYQHDVHQPLLTRKLGEVVESCVNSVGVELNTASAPLLSYVSGLSTTLAKRIVAHREQKGAFRSRHELNDVTGLGPKAFILSAGFLRIRDGAHPLDASAVHPERYELVERIAGDLGVDVPALIGNNELISRIDVSRYVGDSVGEETLNDIVNELKKPGRDPRSTFEPPKFREDVTSLEDLKEGMSLEGVVTNVTAFGAFVDVGVHQDGLVHISQLADRFVRDPHEVVRVGDRITVRVVEVDLVRRRIALSARTSAMPAGKASDNRRGNEGKRRDRPGATPPTPPRTFSNNPFAALKDRKN